MGCGASKETPYGAPLAASNDGCSSSREPTEKANVTSFSTTAGAATSTRLVNTLFLARLKRLVDAPADEDFSDLRGPAAGCKIPKTEERAITLSQLLALKQHIQRRCRREKWINIKQELLKPDEVSLYECCAYVIKPLTQAQRSSYIEIVATGPQPPKWFCSHWWGESVYDFVACIETHADDHGYSLQKKSSGGDNSHYDPMAGYWVCAYANNQWSLNDEIAESLEHTSFRKAIDASQGALSILDGGGMCFRRVWCSYEVHVALTQVEGLKYEVYTAKPHTVTTFNMERPRSAVGIVDGLGRNPFGNEEDAGAKTDREAHFPFEAARAGFSLMLERAESSVEDDRIRILNTIAGQADLLDTPPAAHANYDALNDLLRGRLALVSLRGLLDAGESISHAAPLLAACGLRKITLGFNRCSGLDALNMELIATHLPPGLEVLEMKHTNLNDRQAEGLGKGMQSNGVPSLTSLELEQNRIGDEGAKAISKAIARCPTLTDLGLGANCIENEGAFAIADALRDMERLTALRLHRNQIGAAGALAIFNVVTAGNLNELWKTLRQGGRVDLEDNKIGDEGAKKMAEALVANRALKLALFLDGNGLSPEGKAPLQEAAKDREEKLILPHL